MKRGIEILTCWLLIIVAVDFLLPTRSIPRTSLEGYCHLFALISLPFAPWFYARHSHRLSPVICYGLLAGVYCVVVPLSLFYDVRGRFREITLGRELFAICFPLLMASFCAGLCSLRRFLDRDNEKTDAS